MRIFRKSFGERIGIKRLLVAPRPFERPLFLDLDHFQIRDRRFKMRIPIHKALVLVDELFIVKLDKDLGNGADHLVIRRAILAHGEPLARPVTRRTQPLQLVDDQSARLLFPVPHAV